MDPLDQLAVQLTKCRRQGNRLTLEWILQSAKILSEAKTLAKRGFGAWLSQKARMDRSTACRHLRVGRFVRENVALMQQISTLSLVKIYALSCLDSAQAVRLLTGQLKMSEPIDQISDLRFRQEFRVLFPPPKPRHSRQHVFDSTTSALAHAEKAVQHATAFVQTMTAEQRRKLESQIHALLKLVATWKRVA